MKKTINIKTEGTPQEVGSQLFVALVIQAVEQMEQQYPGSGPAAIAGAMGCAAAYLATTMGPSEAVEFLDAIHASSKSSIQDYAKDISAGLKARH